MVSYIYLYFFTHGGQISIRESKKYTPRKRKIRKKETKIKGKMRKEEAEKRTEKEEGR
jgi:hypothetical protein